MNLTMDNHMIILEDELAKAYADFVGKRNIAGLSAEDHIIKIGRFGRTACSMKEENKEDENSISEEGPIYYVSATDEQETCEPVFMYSFDNIIFKELKQRAAMAKELLGIKDNCISMIDADILKKDRKFICKTSLLINDERYISAHKIVSLLDNITSDSFQVSIDQHQTKLFIDSAKFFKENMISISDLYKNRNIFFSQYEFSSYLSYYGENSIKINYFSNSANSSLPDSKIIAFNNPLFFGHLNDLGAIRLDYDYIEMLKQNVQNDIISKEDTSSCEKGSLTYYSQLYQKAQGGSQKLFMIDSLMNFRDAAEILKKEGYLNSHFPFIADFDNEFLKDMYNKVKIKNQYGGIENGN